MKKAAYVKKIRAAMQKAGTDKEQYSLSVETLGEILERRDEVEKIYKKDPLPIIEHTNKAGATNYEQNPALRMINELNKSALLYMRELGLTPQALRRINPDEVKEDKKKASYFSKMEETEPTEKNKQKGNKER